MDHATRRQFLRHTASLGALLAWGCDTPAAIDDKGNTLDSGGEPLCPDPFADGEFLGVIDFTGEPDNAFGVKTEQGWDARVVFELASLEPDQTLSPNDSFYVRTELPDLLDTSREDWRITATGLVGSESSLSLADLEPLMEDMGEVMLECAGNTGNRNFGLMSAASWRGVPLARVLELIDVDAAATSAVITGFDEHSVPSDNNHSTPGAAWWFRLEDLADRAFLALEMNGEPLPPDHGEPVRLMMPGWYGCAHIKWVQEIRLTDDTEPATSQMSEFATRTDQPGGQSGPSLAADFDPATMELAALPVRVEQWRVDGQLRYRVIGITWGGSATTDALVFKAGNTRTPVTVCPAHSQLRSWTLWVHAWVPARAGSFQLSMEVDDDAVPTNRLDEGWYTRSVEIPEV